MNAAERQSVLSRAIEHSPRFEEAAKRRSRLTAEVIPVPAPLPGPEQEPTQRELEVLQLVAEGLGNGAIAKRLFLSQETVKTHVRHLLWKLDAQSRTHAVTIAFRRGLLS